MEPAKTQLISVQQTIDQIVARLVIEADPEAIILFGSQAKGTAGHDSDVDLLVIEQEPFSKERSRWRESTRLQMALREFDISTDILLYSRDEFDSWKSSINHVIGRASREGRFLYERH